MANIMGDVERDVLAYITFPKEQRVKPHSAFLIASAAINGRAATFSSIRHSGATVS
ncbi:hypothetical protein [Roseovarius sp. ZX-A-9]|uniref:hypothetical protein n=1 Tax=Roseovarius sp. ZX-A-9 TaxID=3014783 RepID=UPI00232B4BCE|nr:hypothetical protein [Roseovarius sp. ZX-A-9]